MHSSGVVQCSLFALNVATVQLPVLHCCFHDLMSWIAIWKCEVKVALRSFMLLGLDIATASQSVDLVRMLLWAIDSQEEEQEVPNLSVSCLHHSG